GPNRGAVLWDTATWTQVRSLPSGQTCWAVAYSPDGARIYAGGFAGQVDVWNAATGEHIASIDAHERLIAGLAVSPDGATLATGSGDGLVKIWDVGTLRELAVFATRHNEAIALGCDPARSRLAAACQADATIVWDFDLLDRWIEGSREYQRGP